MRVLRPGFVALGLMYAAAPAGAASITPDQATALEQQVRQWAAELIGPAGKLSARPVEIQAAGDHYDVVVPIKLGHDTLRLTAVARPLDGGKWAVDEVRLPSPVEFTADLPQSRDGDGTPAALTGPVSYRMSFGRQAGTMLLDPAYTVASTFSSALEDFALDARAQHGHVTARLARSTSSTVVTPAADSRVNVLTEGTLDGYAMTTEGDAVERLSVAIGRARVTAQANALSRARATQIVQALAQVQAMAAAGAGRPGGLDPKALGIGLDALADVASGLSIDETFQTMSVTYGGAGGTLAAARMALDAKAERGLLQASLDIGAEGLAFTGLPLDDMAQLIPTRVALRPAVSGVSVADLMRLLKDSEAGKAVSDADIAALFGHGGITAGLESFALDLGGASFTGSTRLLFTAPNQFTGTAQIAATNLDALQQRVAATPALAQFLPLLFVAKGIGRTVQNRTVWDVSYNDGKVLINNQDLSAFMGGGGGGGGIGGGLDAAKPRAPATSRPR